MPATLMFDTCAWLDAFAAPELLKPLVREILAGEQLLYVLAISVLEVARKEAKGELVFRMSLSKWFQAALPTNRARVLDITPEIAIFDFSLQEKLARYTARLSKRCPARTASSTSRPGGRPHREVEDIVKKCDVATAKCLAGMAR